MQRSHGPSGHINGHSLELGVILGKLLDRSERMVAMQHHALKTLDRTADTLGRIEQKMTTSRSGRPRIPRVERWFKIALTIIPPGLTLWATGSIEAALRVLASQVIR